MPRLNNSYKCDREACAAYDLINNGNCTEWSAIWSEIKRVITNVITSLISDQNCTTRSAISTLLHLF